MLAVALPRPVLDVCRFLDAARAYVTGDPSFPRRRQPPPDVRTPPAPAPLPECRTVVLLDGPGAAPLFRLASVVILPPGAVSVLEAPAYLLPAAPADAPAPKPRRTRKAVAK